MKDQGVGIQYAKYYLEFAEFEKDHDVQKAKEILQSGIMQNAQPIEKLSTALRNAWKDTSSQTTLERRNSTSRSSASMKPVTLELSPTISPQKRKIEQVLSPKRQRTENGMVEVPASNTITTENFEPLMTKGKKKETSEENNMSLIGDEMSLTLSDTSEAGHGTSNDDMVVSEKEKKPTKEEKGSAPRAPPILSVPASSSKVETTEVSSKKKSPMLPGAMIAPQSSTMKPTPEMNPKNSTSDILGKLHEPKTQKKEVQKETTSSLRTQSTQKRSTLVHFCSASSKDGGSAFKRPLLLSKTPRLMRVGLSGKPQRVGSEQSTIDSSDSDASEGTGNSLETLDIPKEIKEMVGMDKEKTKKPTAKITKTDLDYMWAWNPDEHPRRASGTGSKHSSSSDSSKELKTPGPTQDTDAAPTSTNNNCANPQSSQTRKSIQSTDSEQSHRSELTNGSSHGNERSCGSTDGDKQTLLSPTKAKLIASSNYEFLPLVNENNILHVNNTPYVKLGVVGKGGSSKVYRALSKDCTVLAIKKVKLSGMDRKAIDGYANEIALLKRLRGNPAIIQMYDSEVDIKRKAIFVVMEAGEVDLNHVLQQQATVSAAASNGKTRALNINFIRLTWQQMLSAVHSIHEERIIHGDLKPANFLFVRGGLKLIDFGIAKAIQSDDTTNIYRESQIGTLNYMSPEAIKDTGSGKNGSQMKLGRASDIWSLGCILYQMAYGKTPFASLHMIQKLQAIINPDHEISFPNTVDEAAIDAMKRCLRRKPEERPPIVGIGGLLNEHQFLNSKSR